MANYDGHGSVYFQARRDFLPVYKGDGRLTTTWLKALGIDYVATGDERSSDPYKA